MMNIKRLSLLLIFLFSGMSAHAQFSTFDRVYETTMASPVVIGDKFVFVSNNEAYGTELWVSDGTTSGTEILLDIEPGPDDSSPNHLTLAGGKVYFMAQNSTFGRELWVTDGTAGGTMMLKDIFPGEQGHDYSFIQLHAHNDQFFAFLTQDPVLVNPEMEMWTSDGTEAGTVKVKTLCDCGTPGAIADYNGDMYFAMGLNFFKSDGTEAGTTGLNDDSFPTFYGEIVAFGEDLYLVDDFDDRVYISDGETATLLLDATGGAASSPEHFHEFDGKVYFSAENKIYVTDGTVEGTIEFADIKQDWNNTGGDNAQRFFVWNDHLYFVGKDQTTETSHFYKTDGDPANISKVAETTEYGAFYDTEFLPTEDYLFVIANGEVVVLNDELEGQNLSLRPNPEYTLTGDSYTASNLLMFNDQLYFRANVNWTDNAIWTIDPNNMLVSNELLDVEQLTAFPNPSADRLFVEGLPIGSSYTICAMNGKLLTQAIASDSAIDVSALSPGMYLLQIENDKGSQSLKFVKQ